MISELNTGQGSVNVEGTISGIEEPKTFNKFGKELSVANATLKDDSGSIKLTLWNDDITRFKEGDKIKVVNGYVNEFQGEKQLTSGKFGSIEKIDSSQESLPSDEAPSEEQTDAPTEAAEETPTESEEPESEPTSEESESEPTSEESEEPKEEVF